MRVLMIGRFAARGEKIDGGVTAVISYLTEALARRDDVELVGARLGAATDDVSHDERCGFPIHNIASKPFGLMTMFRSQRRRFEEIVRSVQPDLVHGQGADLAGFLACRSGKPAVVTVHGIIGEDAKFKTRVVERIRETLSSRLIERKVINEARTLILISPYVAEYYGAAIRGSTYHIPNPVSQAYFDITPRPERGRILFVGRVIPRKGVLDLINALSVLKIQASAHLVIAGSLADTKYVARVSRLISELGLVDKVRLVGLLNETEVLSEFARAQMLVLPSYQETAPMVILQAMAAGLPVIASRICGIPFLVDEAKTGLTHVPGDVAALSAHLSTLLTEPDVAIAMGERGREKALAQFHATSVAAETTKVYRLIAGDSVGRKPTST